MDATAVWRVNLMKTSTRTPWFALAIVLFGCCGTLALLGRSEDSLPSVFELPSLQARYLELQQPVHELLTQGKYEQAERRCLAAVRLLPQAPEAYYNLACAQARQGKREQAMRSLARAVENGFRQSEWMSKDPDLENLRVDPQFASLVEKAQRIEDRQPTGLHYKVSPSVVQEGKAWVRDGNTAWGARTGLFYVLFAFPGRSASPTAEASPSAETGTPSERPKDADSAGQKKDGGSSSTETIVGTERPPVIMGHGEVGDLLRGWFAEGTAAGHTGDLYDNHDDGHSRLRGQDFPQLAAIQFDPSVKRQKLHVGLQSHFLYSAVTFGNSSMAKVSSPFWRSMPRLAYADPRGLAILANQYANNHLYVYPEHRDHDPGHNGGGGYGDVFCTNTPYVIISQGSSGSDRPFLHALACTLAAFRPEVKQALVRHRLLAPTLQLIFRSCNAPLESPRDYLTGRAHPTVFRGEDVDVKKMIIMAHEMRSETIPPLVGLKVLEEDEAVVGRDYFHHGPGERLFNSREVIARVVRSTKYTRRLVVSAEGSLDPNQRALTWHWSVLRGDANKIRIRPLNPAGSVVQLTVPYHPRRPVEPGSDLESNRVDIGAFVHNGKYFSAPAFVTFFTLDNEQRVYSDDGLIQSVTYTDPAHKANYVDPVIDTPKHWRDEYHYDAERRLIGWTRHRGPATEDFNADGALVTLRDELGRPTTAIPVVYEAVASEGKPAVLRQRLGDKLLRYEYASEQDRVGRVRERDEAPKGEPNS